MKQIVIRDWIKNFENKRSQQVKNCNFVCLPNRYNSPKVLDLIEEDQGLEMFSVFVLICEMHSKVYLDRRNGILMQDEKRPHTARTIARELHLEVDIVEKTIETLSEEPWLWLVYVGEDTESDTSHVHDNDIPCTHHVHDNDTEGKGREGNRIYIPDNEIILNWWNAIAVKEGFPEIRKITDARRRHLKTRCVKDAFWEHKDLIASKLHSFSAFHRKSNWMGFDFIVKSEDNLSKLLEGKYDEKDNNGRQNIPPPLNKEEAYS
ncbi:MAG: hypothetical protein EOM12_12745 [Verrucomicrobiae bacterium]|nr:hypothetical protein [Verrucomicrobiae bacterium]